MNRDAVLSPDGLYRYRLSRWWADGPRVAFFMMNPSTADASEDDATIRKCIGFAQRWGFAGIEVVNLSAWRSRDPKALQNVDDLFGPDYWKHLGDALENCPVIVLAWGCEAHLKGRLYRHSRATPEVIKVGYPGLLVRCLGRTKGGTPRHPLMLAYGTPLEDA